MNNKKGFTLIELLAVIVLLGIVSTIGITSIIKRSNEAKEKAKYIAAKDIVEMASAYLIKNDYKCVSVEVLTNANYLDKKIINPRTNDLTWNSGEKKDTEICMCMENCYSQTNYDVNNNNNDEYYYAFDEYNYIFDKKSFNNSDENGDKKDQSPTEIVKNVKYDIERNTIKIGDSEEFYIIDANKDKFYALAYNKLNFDTNRQDESINLIENKNYGYTIKFSDTNYWYNNESKVLNPSYGDSFPAFVYDEHSLIYEKIEKYKEYLIEEGKVDLEITLMSKEQAEKNGCSIEKHICEGATSEYIVNTSYWLGTSYSNATIYRINASIHSNGIFITPISYSTLIVGVKPVIVIDKSELE